MPKTRVLSKVLILWNGVCCALNDASETSSKALLCGIMEMMLYSLFHAAFQYIFKHN